MDNFEETLRMASNGDMIAQYEIGAFYETMIMLCIG